LKTCTVSSPSGEGKDFESLDISIMFFILKNFRTEA
jgi:hypothetical protein